jgi:predicted RNA-binding Zn-ribbon protein involved in translation (DUF1610 family)
MMSQGDSACRKAILCSFKVIGDYQDAQVEICIHCGKKLIYQREITEFAVDEKGKPIIKRGSRVDNAKYLRDHKRDFVQPHGKTRNLFLKLYGQQPIDDLANSLRNKKSKKDIEDSWNEIRDSLKR